MIGSRVALGTILSSLVLSSILTIYSAADAAPRDATTTLSRNSRTLRETRRSLARRRRRTPRPLPTATPLAPTATVAQPPPPPREQPTSSPTPAPPLTTATHTPTPTHTVTPRSTSTVTPAATPTPQPTATAVASATPTPPLLVTPPPAIPNRAVWESNMKVYGAQHCQALRDTGRSFDDRLSRTYYDAEWVYLQIADYTKDTSWLSCASAARAVYRDGYVVANGGKIPGYWVFSHGITQHYLRTGDLASRSAQTMLSQNAAFAPDTTPLSSTVDHTLSREVAYTMMSYLNAEDVGQPRRSRLRSLEQQALGHLSQWFTAKTASYIRPFMVALTAHALISYEERIGDSAILPALINAADQMWSTMWLPGSNAFKYTNVNTALFDPSAFAYNSGGTEPAPDLNLLIAPLYAWLYHQTGEVRFLTRGDAIFSGGLNSAFLAGAKQFNQNYRWSFEYIRLRSLPPLTSP